MRVHILGIGGTFMSGLALLARQCGHNVSGSDMNVYPPMSTQLAKENIQVMEGYEANHINTSLDYVIVGNVVKRGNPAMEYILNHNIPYISGPQWLFENVLKSRHVLAVSGTHGKTTTSSLLAYILDHAGFSPGFLIGGIPENFGISARLGRDPYFVIEADEYDSAFFDKRSKFIHYHPKTLILNNLEYDHADIFADLDAIKLQFHYLVRTMPSLGHIIRHIKDTHVDDVLKMGCFSQVLTIGSREGFSAKLLKEDGSAFTVFYQDEAQGDVSWNLVGEHNVDNALSAIAAAFTIKISPKQAMQALSSFKNVKRRLEVKGKINEIIVYDDFAHHPTAIASTLAGLRAKVGLDARIIAVVEFGSYTMRKGVHKDKIKDAFYAADMVVCKDTEADWGLKSILGEFKQKTALYDNVDILVENLVKELRGGDHVIVMSNASFDGIHQKLLASLEKRIS